MLETSSTNTIPVGVIAHAMRAVAAHLFDHHLPAPLSIQVTQERDAILVQVDSSQSSIEAWTQSLHIDQASEHQRGHVRYVTRHGRLPDSGVRVDLLSVHFDATPLQAVTA